MKKIDAYSYNSRGIPGICKAPVILVRNKGENGWYPMVYFRKPRGVSRKMFDKFTARLDMWLKQAHKAQV